MATVGANMSSCYSSPRSSRGEVVVKEMSKSVPETPAKPQRPAFRTVPDSPKHNRLLSDDHGLDLEILTHKLQLYQLELEETELRVKQKRAMREKRAAEVAAAARFRNELDRHEKSRQLTGANVTMKRARSASAQHPSVTASPGAGLPIPAPTSTLVRPKKPQPLLLSSASVRPQEVQSALLPVRRDRDLDMAANHTKRYWRTTTIAAGRNAGSKIVLISSPGKLTEYDLPAGMPPVPRLSDSSPSVTSPPTMSPMTPKATEDQIRRELETFALEEGPNIQLSRRNSAASRRPIPAAFVPDTADILTPSNKKSAPDNRAADVQLPSPTVQDAGPVQPSLVRKKSFFSRFERKNAVDDLLDLYMTEEQLVEDKAHKRKPTRSRKQTLFNRLQPADNLFHKPEKPR